MPNNAERSKQRVDQNKFRRLSQKKRDNWKSGEHSH
jgi:hypothetical protein